MSEEETEEFYLKLGYQSQSDYFDKRLPIYNDFLSFEEYSKQLQAKTIPPDIVEQLDDTEIKFSEDELVEFDYTPNLFYANLAKEAYQNVRGRKDFLNYKYLQNESSENLATYINDEKKELSFAIPGTSKAGDLIMDTSIAIASAPLLGFDGRYEAINNKINEVKNKYDDYSVSITGHSAGGSLANYLGVDNPDYAINTFNMAQGLPFLTNTIKCKLGLGNCDNINNFRIIGDWASGLSESFSPGKVFNMKPIIPTDKMNLQADSQETFYYPTYMGLPHNINQFIDRDQELPDYGQYGRKLAGTLGGLSTAVGLPIVTKKIGDIVDSKIEPLMEEYLGRTFLSDAVFQEGELENFQFNLERANIGTLPELIKNPTTDALDTMRRSEAIDLISKKSYLPSIKSNLDYITESNSVFSGLAGFGLGEIAGTGLYEGALKPDVTPLQSKERFVTQTEITDFDEDKYYTNIPASIILGAGISGMYLGSTIGYLINNNNRYMDDL